MSDRLIQTIVATPIGSLLVAATDLCVIRVAFALEDFDAVARSLSQLVAPPRHGSNRVIDQAHRELDEYFTHTRCVFTVPVDLNLSRGFHHQVQQYLPQIPYGHRVSYREIARGLGHPGAIRAVGSACARNPVPLLVPCHRVVRADGSLGGYRGSLAVKQFLLDLETHPR